MAREKREFVPGDPERITMYVCGPTVYGRAHIGNARPAVVFDTLARLIRHQFGADSLVYARNITDVDDKIIAAAEAEGVGPLVITARYEAHYLADMGALGVSPPSGWLSLAMLTRPKGMCCSMSSPTRSMAR
jgi:cysteinyl-tRNA synthetase